MNTLAGDEPQTMSTFALGSSNSDYSSSSSDDDEQEAANASSRNKSWADVLDDSDEEGAGTSWRMPTDVPAHPPFTAVVSANFAEVNLELFEDLFYNSEVAGFWTTPEQVEAGQPPKSCFVEFWNRESLENALIKTGIVEVNEGEIHVAVAPLKNRRNPAGPPKRKTVAVIKATPLKKATSFGRKAIAWMGNPHAPPFVPAENLQPKQTKAKKRKVKNPPAKNPPAKNPLAKNPPAKNPPAKNPPAKSPPPKNPPPQQAKAAVAVKSRDAATQVPEKLPDDPATLVTTAVSSSQNPEKEDDTPPLTPENQVIADMPDYHASKEDAHPPAAQHDSNESYEDLRRRLTKIEAMLEKMVLEMQTGDATFRAGTSPPGTQSAEDLPDRPEPNPSSEVKRNDPVSSKVIKDVQAAKHKASDKARHEAREPQKRNTYTRSMSYRVWRAMSSWRKQFA
mmetsp:Transcript_1098/g.2265  ORF Transcript_1098/g.2265 Transcript_1098/m.2265 type:complete len:451 (+) Transcript_1098:253-1605(+)